MKWSQITEQVSKLEMSGDPEVVAIVYNSIDGGMTTVSDKADEDGEVFRDEYDKLEFLFAEPYTFPPDTETKLQLVFQLKE